MIAKQACDKRRPHCGRCRGTCVYSQPGYTVLRMRKSPQQRYERDGSRSRVAKLDRIERLSAAESQKTPDNAHPHENNNQQCTDDLTKLSYTGRTRTKRTLQIEGASQNAESKKIVMEKLSGGEFVYIVSELSRLRTLFLVILQEQLQPMWRDVNFTSNSSRNSR